MRLFTFSNTVACAIAAIGLVTSPMLLAQEEGESIGIEMLQSQDGAPIIISSSSQDLGNGSSQSMRIFASSDPDSMSSGMFVGDMMGGGMSGSGDAFSMLSNKSVQQDLELVGDQLDKVNKLRSDFGKEMQEQVKMLTSGESLDGQAFGQRLKELQAEQKEKIEAMLLPHQLERLKQVKLQMQMQKQGAARTLDSKLVAEALGIDAAQKKKIKKRAVELKKELEERTKALQEDIRNKLLEELTSEQKEKLAELKGEKFEYKKQNIGDMIRKQMENRKRSKQEEN